MDHSSSSSIVFTGDISFDRYMDRQWCNEHLLSDEILTFFHTADHVVANVEGPLYSPTADRAPSDKGMFCHYMDPEAASVLKKIRADVWCLANNHSLDMGKPGLDSTTALAKKNKAKAVGAGRCKAEAASPVILPECGGIGLLAVGYPTVCPAAGEDTPGVIQMHDMDAIVHAIHEVKKECRYCIMISHGGEEFTNLPHPYVRKLYADYIRAGADAVVAHHPHVTMGYEFFDGKPVFYSLGNFIFDTDYQRRMPNTDTGVLLKIHFTESGLSFEPLGIKILRGQETVAARNVPPIFTQISAEEYKKLLPLSAKLFIKSELYRLAHINPRYFLPLLENDWYEYFMKHIDCKGVQMDYPAIFREAKKEKDAQWKLSRLPAVREYILSQFDHYTLDGSAVPFEAVFECCTCRCQESNECLPHGI